MSEKKRLEKELEVLEKEFREKFEELGKLAAEINQFKKQIKKHK